MKKRIIIMTGIVATAISCTTEFLAVPESSEIRFENAFVNKLTKADVTNSTLKSFHVFATTPKNELIFNDMEVTRNGYSWEYSGTRFWDIEGRYAFAAYAPSEAAESMSDIHHDWESNQLTFNYNSDAEHQHDIILAEASVYSDQTSVALDFRHLMSIVYVVIRSGEGSGLTFNINSLKLSGVNTTAHFNGKTFESLGTPGTYPMLPEEGATCTQAQEITSQAIYVLPQQIADDATSLEMNLNVTDTMGNILTYNDSMQISLPAAEWEASKTYVITADLIANDVNPEIKLYKIEFGVDGVNGWTDGGSANL